MNTHNLNKTSKNKDDFQQLWERRKEAWRQEAEMNAPDDATLLKMARRAHSVSAVPEENIMPSTIRRRSRWIPYAAAASLIIGVAAIGLNRHTKVDETIIPMAQEVDVDGNTMFFLCNNGCSVDEVILAANDVIKK